MDWNIIIPITIFIGDILLAWFCYRLGCYSVKPIKINNEKLLKQQEELENQLNEVKTLHKDLVTEDTDLTKKIASTKEELLLIKKTKDALNESNKQTQEFIAQSEQLAKEKAKAIYEQEILKNEKQLNVIKEYHQKYIDQLDLKVDQVKKELKSLQETRAAAIAAAQKEKEIKENKDDYCLILPREEANDVEILRGIIKKIAKPRAILMAIWQAYYQPIAKKKFPKILGKADVCGIYKITNQETGECYIGQAVDVRRRWMDHCKMMLQIDAPKNNQLYTAAAEYGLDVFSFELLLECESSQLNEKEKYFIELYNSDAIGYNISKGVS